MCPYWKGKYKNSRDIEGPPNNPSGKQDVVWGGHES